MMTKEITAPRLLYRLTSWAYPWRVKTAITTLEM